MLKKQKKHSISDWDWNTVLNRALTTNRYISAPSSLIIGPPGGNGSTTYWLCRHPDTLLISEGRIDWYSWYDATQSPASEMFRNQEPLGNVTFTACYHLEFSSTREAWIWRRNWLDVERLVDFNYAERLNQWCHFRLSWYNGWDEEGTPALVIELEEEIAGVWQAMLPPTYDTVNAFKDSDINRVGQIGHGLPDHPTYHDNTAIYRKVD